MDENSGDMSDELDEFEASVDESHHQKNKNQTTYSNKPYDEAFEISQDLSMAESYDGRDKGGQNREKQLKNDKYDEAVEVSQSMDQSYHIAPAQAKASYDDKEYEQRTTKKTNEQNRSQTLLNKPFDEALEFSQSGSDESVDTRASQVKKKKQQEQKSSAQILSSAPTKSNVQTPAALVQQEQVKKAQTKMTPKPSSGDDDSSSDGENEESYDNLEGAYNPKDFEQLNVIAEVRDLFQYIERYKPQEVELDTPLKCFIPEYLPAIGELDAFIKIPRPDGKEDGLGLRYLDEPSSNQSDPTVLELQLRAKSKKLQYGDVAVRSIEQAEKNPSKIEKWIQDINELHRSKPPPQVNYKKNMPEIEALMDVWPEEFEVLLGNTPLPSPDLDLSLAEYAKTLCTILDIPVYENPVESLHLMFTLFIDFRNNPHFQARLLDQADGKERYERGGGGGADVLEINQGDEADYK